MLEPVQTFHVRRDLNETWVIRAGSGRVYVRSPFKDTVLDLARHIARKHAPCVIQIHSNNGKPDKLMSYSKSR
jgi:hypothetical protein